MPGCPGLCVKVPTISLDRGQEVKVTAEPLCASALRRGRASQDSAAPAPVPPRPPRQRLPGPRLCTVLGGADAARSRKPLAFREMRGQGRGHARWPAPLRSLLRALGPQDAAAQGLAQGKCEGDLGSRAHVGLGDLLRAPVLSLTAAHSQDARCAPSTAPARPASSCSRVSGLCP